MSLVVIGTVAFDAIETPFGKTNKIVGGAATFISLAASYFHKNIKLISVIGDDFPKEAIDMLQGKSVDTKGLQIKEGEKTFFWSAILPVPKKSPQLIHSPLLLYLSSGEDGTFTGSLRSKDILLYWPPDLIPNFEIIFLASL
jgi:hypothetical protein